MTLASAIALHNADGQRWVGFPRADVSESYCTECNQKAPCRTVTESRVDAVDLEDPEALQKVAKAIWQQTFFEEFYTLPLNSPPPPVVRAAQAAIEALK